LRQNNRMKDQIKKKKGWNRAFFLFVFCMVCNSCNNSKEDALNPEAVYFDYKITGEEGNDKLTVMLQYRVGGEEEGDAVSMGKVTLDGEDLPADSTKMSGVFYELHKPIAGFKGKHSILLTGINKKEYKEEFDFQLAELITLLADTIRRNDLTFEFSGLSQKDYLRVLLTDTSFINDGINRVDLVQDGHLAISETDLETLTNGPVQIEFIREYERPVKNGTEAGGRLLITYSLKREFFLKD
jgi:hypothetical protein